MMLLHIREIQRKRKGVIVQHEKAVTTDLVTLGRGTDQTIFIPNLWVSYQHAQIVAKSPKKMRLESIHTGVYVNGELKHKAALSIGDVIRIGNHEICLLAADADDHDLLMTIETLPESDNDALQTLPTIATTTHTNKRGWSWVGFCSMVLVCLVLPLVGTSDAVKDNIWNTGEISPAHRYFAEDCTRCHQTPFQPVQDVACIGCHQSINHHANPEDFHLSAITELRCASCHKEHNGAHYMIREHQTFCASCHRNDPGSALADSPLQAATDFATDHPEFKPLIRQDDRLPANDPTAWQRVSLSDAQRQHASGLTFSHAQHLAAKGIVSPTGSKQLACHDCHQINAGGDYFQPINMEQHCRSCHQMDFDPEAPGRLLQHGQLDAVKQVLLEYYTYKQMQNSLGQVNPSAAKRRRPGQSLTRKEIKVSLDNAHKNAEAMAIDVIEVRTCTTCHQVTRIAEQPVQWHIPEVRSSRQWFTKSQFAHRKHQHMACTDCHAATTSKHSSDVLLPGIAQCRTCHGGQFTPGKLPSGCITCHDFHQKQQTRYTDQNKIDAQKRAPYESLPAVKSVRKMMKHE